MKRLFITIFLISLIFNLFSEISVKSFRKLENDITARVDAPKIDQNGDVCAIIKIVTTQTGFVWEPDGLGIISSDWKNGEYWLYVPYGAKHLTIKHDKLGILRDYMYPLPIEKACVYELVLTSGRIETTVIDEISSQWLLIHADPEKAMIYLDDQFVKIGEYQSKLKPGSYTYRVEMPLYHSEAGKIEIADTKKEINVNLKPAFGNISITSSPESGATVLIDGKEQTGVTPCQSENLASGEHTVQVIKEMYQPSVQRVTINDGQIVPLGFTLQPNFAELNITSTPETKIFVNNQQKGIGTWKGRLNAGVYSLEARREKYQSAKQDLDLATGDVKNIDLLPTPIYGSLDIMTTPAEAIIKIDGKEYGTTPNTINKLLIGDYTVQLSKTGYAIVNKIITITEGKSKELIQSLEKEIRNKNYSNSKRFTFTSNKPGVYLFIDGGFIDMIPCGVDVLKKGKHNIELKRGVHDSVKKVIFVNTENEQSFNFEL